jgi:hypothetical protein
MLFPLNREVANVGLRRDTEGLSCQDMMVYIKGSINRDTGSFPLALIITKYTGKSFYLHLPEQSELF